MNKQFFRRLGWCCCFLLFATMGWSQALTDGEYLIKIYDTGKFFSIAGAAKNNGAWLIQWDNEYSGHFRFMLKRVGDDVYTLRAKHSGKYLSTEGAPRAGAKLIQWDWTGGDNQKWYIVKPKGSRGYVMSCYQNNLKVVLQHFNSLVTPVNGAYTFLQGDVNMRSMMLDFKKNEVDEPANSSNGIKKSLEKTKMY